MYVAFIEFSSISPKSSSINKCERARERKEVKKYISDLPSGIITR